MRPLDPSRFSAAVKARLLEIDMPQARLADLVGVKPPTVSEWLNGKKAPSQQNARAVLDALGLTWAAVEQRDSEVLQAPSDVVFIPLDGPAGAGPAANGDGMDEEALAMSRELLRQVAPYADPDKMRMHIVVGDSMMPEIIPGYRAFYLPAEVINGDGLYVLIMDEGRIVKYVQRRGGGVLRLVSRNKRYLPEEFTPVEDQPFCYLSKDTGRLTYLRVVGKVVTYLRPG